jgi:hypothetical protein
VNPIKRLFFAALAVVLLAFGIAAGSVVGSALPTAQGIFRLTNPHSRGDQGLTIVEFLANRLLKSGRTTSIPADNVFEVDGVEHSDLIVELQLSCDPLPEFGLERSGVSRTFYLVRGPEGFGAIRVKGDKFRVRTPAFDGVSRQGRLTFSGRFSHRGTRVTGAISVDIPALTNEGVALTNCQTDPGGLAAKVGRPLRFDILATG